MNEIDVDLRLDEDFLFILDFSKNYMNAFVDSPEINTLAHQWLSKLCVEVVSGIAAKRLRNTYLVQLISCMQAGQLIPPFDVPPPDGSLDPLPTIENIQPEPPWLEELIQEAREQQGGRGQAKDARTYLATKIFDENKGACAYLAVSVADEGNIPAWIRMGTEEESIMLDRHLEKVFQKIARSELKKSTCPTREAEDEEIHFNRDIAIHLIDLIQMEITGKAAPGQNAEIEEMIERFTISIQNTSLGEYAATLSGPQLRKFLLTQLHSYLLNELVVFGGGGGEC